MIAGHTLPHELLIVDRRAIAADALRWQACLDADERAVFLGLVHDKRRGDWLAGRVAAKRLLQRRSGLPLAQIRIRTRDGGQPFVLDSPLYLSISHSGDLAAACCAPTPIGLDLERIEARPAGFLELVFDAEERVRLAGHAPADRDQAVTLAWCKKEALAKALGVGLRADFARLAQAPQGARVLQGILQHRGELYAWAQLALHAACVDDVPMARSA